VHNSRIAVVGGRPGFKQYVFYGDDLSNHVQYVARHAPHGAYLPIASEAVQKSGEQAANPAAITHCEGWIGALRDGDYAYAVIGPDQRTQSVAPIEAIWTGQAGGVRIEDTDNVFVFRLDRPLNAAGCRSAHASRQPSST
jgi:hypothetical protein